MKDGFDRTVFAPFSLESKSISGIYKPRNDDKFLVIGLPEISVNIFHNSKNFNISKHMLYLDANLR